MLLLLGLAGWLAHAAWPYYVGVAAAAALVAYEDALFRSGANLFVINERVFISNMAFSVVFLGTTVVSFR
jgi:4-hydroxybenzoate polyprenyltransferase